MAVTPDGQTAYVTNQGDNTVTPITVATNTAGTPITVGSNPDAVAVAPSPVTAYVANQRDSTVTPITVATNTAGTPITVGSNPFAVAVTPDGQTAYVANRGDITVTPITVATNTAGTPITVGSAPYAVVVTPDGRTAYVTNFADDTVTPITVATNTAGTPITVGSGPVAVAVTPDGQTAYVTNQGDNTVTPITVATNTAGTPIPVGSIPYGVVVTPDGQTAYVSNFGDATVTPITVATNTAGTPIPVGYHPDAVAVTPDGKTAYVSNVGDGTVTPITVATNTAGTPITVGSNPQGAAVTPDGKTAYVTNQGDSTVTPITVATNTAGTPIPVGSAPLGVGIKGGLQIGNAPALPQASVGAAYSQQLTSVAGTAPFAYSVTSGALPAGLSLSSSGLLTGTATHLSTASFTVAVTDSSTYQQVAVKAFTLQVGEASPSISTSQQPASGSVGSSFADQATVSGGDSPTGTVTFHLYDNASGTGTPLFSDANEPLRSGTATSNGYTATATGTDYWVATYKGDSNNNAVSSGNADEPVTVTQAPAITSAASAWFSDGQPGSFTVTTTGSPTASVSDGGASLPAGVTFVNNGNGTATLSGTPAVGISGTYRFTITASNGASPDATQRFTLTVGPTVSGVSPASGPTGGGTPIRITGTGFVSGATVQVGQGSGAGPSAISATNVVVSSTQITATTSGPAKAGTYYVYVAEAGATSRATNAARFSYLPPAVSKVSPASGPVSGGTPVTITGSGFGPGATVEIDQGSGPGASAIAATNVKVRSSTKITAATGGSAQPGRWHLYVIDSAGTSPATNSDLFAYTIRPTASAVTPGSGPVSGNTAIRITGTGFVAGAKVQVGQGSGPGSSAISATQVHVVSPTQITAHTGGVGQGRNLLRVCGNAGRQQPSQQRRALYLHDCRTAPERAACPGAATTNPSGRPHSRARRRA